MLLLKEVYIWDQIVDFAYITIFRVEGNQVRILCKSKPLPTSEMRQRATKYCRWEILLKYGQCVDSVCYDLCSGPLIWYLSSTTDVTNV
jgi:hypothetical protein